MRNIFAIIALLLCLTVIGTVGLRIIEEAPWIDCLYMCVITLTTVGHEDVVDLTDAGKLFIVVYLISCLGVFTYSAFQLGQWIVSAEVNSMLERRRMEKRIRDLNQHFIVCGIGRMGKTICEYLHGRSQPFVVIDTDQESLTENCKEHGWLYLHGDATDDDVLISAGIERAKSLASVLPTDADNVYVVLSARMLNSNVQIIARAEEETAMQKLERAGATRVISPFSSGAVKMARFMLNPSIEDFLEIADNRGTDLELADVQIPAGSPYVGKKLMETDLRDKGIMVIGIRRSDGERLLPPPGSAIIEVGDCLFAFGSANSIISMIEESESQAV